MSRIQELEKIERELAILRNLRNQETYKTIDRIVESKTELMNAVDELRNQIEKQVLLEIAAAGVAITTDVSNYVADTLHNLPCVLVSQQEVA